MCEGARRGSKVDAFRQTGEICVRNCASGFWHSEAANYVSSKVTGAVSMFSEDTPRYVRTGADGMFGTNVVSDPDVAIRSVSDANGTPLRDLPEAPVFFCEVEDNNRSLPALIRHLGMLHVNFPNLNGLVGIKGGHTEEWRTMGGFALPQRYNCSLASRFWAASAVLCTSQSGECNPCPTTSTNGRETSSNAPRCWCDTRELAELGSQAKRA